MYVKAEEFQQNVRTNKQVLKELAALVTEELQKRGAVTGWDFRFLIVIAQWLVEQGGYTMHPEGNNPGNVMGTGDAGFFKRPHNTEIVDGIRVPRPNAEFAKYSSMRVATAAKLDLLRDKWPLAYHALLAGRSSNEYVSGLYPGKGKDYATAARVDYMIGLKVRLTRQVIPHYILTCDDDISEIDKMAAAIPAVPVTPDTSLDYRNDIALNKNAHTVLGNLRAELKQVLQRANAGQDVQG